jgi:hypothetical protein
MYRSLPDANDIKAQGFDDSRPRIDRQSSRCAYKGIWRRASSLLVIPAPVAGGGCLMVDVIWASD